MMGFRQYLKTAIIPMCIAHDAAHGVPYIILVVTKCWPLSELAEAALVNLSG